MLRQRLGETRSSIQVRHAVLSADSHERTTLPNWGDAEVVFTISPQMGAQFSQYFAHMEAGGRAEAPLPSVERFVMILDGAVSLEHGDGNRVLGPESYAYLPAGYGHKIHASSASRLVVFERRFLPLEGAEPTYPVIGEIGNVEAVPDDSDSRLMFRKLMPEEVAFDCEFNVMEFSPGASLPYVETHFMEHGLLMLNGGGIYRLDERWYPVEKGDVIWMGPYCPQWFGALGEGNARYLLYKIWNRDPLATNTD